MWIAAIGHCYRVDVDCQPLAPAANPSSRRGSPPDCSVDGPHVYDRFWHARFQTHFSRRWTEVVFSLCPFRVDYVDSRPMISFAPSEAAIRYNGSSVHVLSRISPALSVCLLIFRALAQDWNVVARHAQDSGDYRQAAYAYSRLLEREPHNVQLLSNLGIMDYLAGEDRQALVPLGEALKLSPNLVPATLFTGLSLLRLSQPADALPYLERAERAGTYALLPLLGLARAEVALRRPRRANDYYFRATQLDQNSAEAWLGLGATYRALLDSTAARIGQIAPDSPQAKRELSGPGEVCARPVMLVGERAVQRQQNLSSLVELASCYYSLALSALAKAVELDPGGYQTHLILGEALSEQKDASQAIREYEAAIHIRPDAPAAYLGLATIHWKDRDYDSATSRLKKVLELSPDDPEANAMMADMLVRDEKFQEARPFALRAIQGNAELAVARVSLAKILMSESRLADAVEELNKAVAGDLDGSYYYMLFRALLELGRKKEADAALASFHQRRALFRK